MRIGNASTFHNATTSYSLGFPKSDIKISTAVNATYNIIGREDAFTWGPTLSVNKKLFKKKLNTTLSASYSAGDSQQSGKNTTTNFRISTSYVYKKKHNFNLNAIQLFKSTLSRDLQNLTVTFGYSYAFDLLKIKLPKGRSHQKLDDVKPEKEEKVKQEKIKKPKKERNKKDKGFKFSYKTHSFEGEPVAITPEVLAISKEEQFKKALELSKVKTQLTVLAKEMKKAEKNKKKYKEAAVAYLKYLYHNKDLKDLYDKLLFESLKKLYSEANQMDYRIQEDFILLQQKVNDVKVKNM